MNTKRDRSENCGSESKGTFKFFSKCKAKDIKCRKLPCENNQRLPHIEKHPVPHAGHMVLGCWVFLNHRQGWWKLKDAIYPMWSTEDLYIIKPAKISLYFTMTATWTSVMGGVFAIIRTATMSMSMLLLHVNSRVIENSVNSGPASCVPLTQNDEILIILIQVLLNLLLFLIPTIFSFANIHRRSKTSINAKNSL